MANTLAPLEAPFSEEVEALLAEYPQRDGYILSLFRTFAHSTRFLRKGVSNLLDKESPIDLRTREIVILRTTANRRCEYEWGIHVAVFSGAAGLTKEQVVSTFTGELGVWNEHDAQLISVIDEICFNGRLSSYLLKSFQTSWNNEQQLEILNLIGNYSTISYVSNVAELENEPMCPKFPKTATM